MFEKLVLEWARFFGWPAAILVCGAILDGFCSAALKKNLSERIAGRKTLAGPGDAVSLFNHGILSKFPGIHVASFDFLFRSIIISAATLSVVVLLQSVANGASIAAVLRASDWLGFLFIVFLAATCLTVDYLANVCTVAILRIAEHSKNLWDLVVLSAANVVLTITLFTWIFPLGVIVCVYADALLNRSQAFQIANTKVSSAIAGAIRGTIAGSPSASSAFVFTLSPINIDMIGENTAGNLMVVNREIVDVPTTITRLLPILGKSNPEYFLPFAQERIVTVTLPPPSLRAHLVARAYYSGFGIAEHVRTSFIDVVRLYPVAASLSSVYDGIRAELARNGLTEGRSLCQGGVVSVVYAKPNDAGALATAANAACGGQYVLAAAFLGPGSFDEAIRSSGATSVRVPLAAFFLSSFAVSLVYYIALAIAWVGLSIMKLTSQLFKAGVVRTEDLPFTVLSLVIFLPMFLIKLALTG